MRKVFWVFAPLLFSGPAGATLPDVTRTVINTHDNQSVVEFSTGTAMNRLSNLRKKQLECLYAGGISKNSFEGCFGRNYASLNSVFVDFISTYREDLVHGFRSDLNKACPEISSPCDDLVSFLDGRIMKDPDVMDELPRVAEEKKDYQAVDSRQLDEALSHFKNRYVVYKNIRLFTAKTVIDTVNSIQSYINASVRSTSLPTDFDYKDFDSNVVFQSLGLGNIDLVSSGPSVTTSDPDQIVVQSIFKAGSLNNPDERKRKLAKQLRKLAQPLASKPMDGRSLDNYNFLKGLLSEEKHQKVLTYYFANGLVDPKQLDLSELPSVTLDLIAKNRLKLNMNLL